MKKYNVIILAGREKSDLTSYAKVTNKALISIYGKFMVDIVIEAFAKSSYVKNIVVVGGKELKKIDSMDIIRKRVQSAASLINNLLLGIGYIKSRIYKYKDKHRGYIISFCDAIYLKTKIIDDVISKIDKTDADIVLNYVEKSTYDKANIKTKRTYIPIGNKLYTGTTIYYIRQFRTVAKVVDKLAKIRKYRKNPEKILEILKCKNDSLKSIEKGLSKYIGAKLKIHICKYPQMGMDIDKPSDLQLAKKMLKKGF